jgi:hypothetical protein
VSFHTQFGPLTMNESTTICNDEEDGLGIENGKYDKIPEIEFLNCVVKLRVLFLDEPSRASSCLPFYDIKLA